MKRPAIARVVIRLVLLMKVKVASIAVSTSEPPAVARSVAVDVAVRAKEECVPRARTPRVVAIGIPYLRSALGFFDIV